MFVGVFDSSGIDSLHVGKVDERSDNRFNGFTSHSHHFLGVCWVFVQLLMHSVVMFFVDTVIYFFELGGFTTTLFSKWTHFTTAFTTAIGAFGVAFAVGLFAFEV